MPESAAKSILGMAVAVTGDLNADDPIRIDGTIVGDIRGTFVAVSRGASVKGSIFAETVHIAGSVIGRIEAVTVNLTKDAQLDGVINCQKLGIEKGAGIRADCKMSQSGGQRDGRDHEGDAIEQIPALAFGDQGDDPDLAALREPQPVAAVEADEPVGPSRLAEASVAIHVDGQDRREPSLDMRSSPSDRALPGPR